MGVFDTLKSWVSGSEESVQDEPVKELQHFDESVQQQIEQQVLQKYTQAGWTLEEFKESFKDFKERHNIDDPSISNAYSAIYVKVSEYLQKKFRDVEQIRKFYLAETAIDQIAEDALTPDIVTGDIITVTSKKSEIKKRIDRIQDKWNFDKIILDIAPDLIAHGEYKLSTEVSSQEDSEGDKKQEIKEGTLPTPDDPPEHTGDKDDDDPEFGLIDLRDDVNQAHVVAVTNFGEIEGYLHQDEDNGKVQIAEPADFIYFGLDTKRQRIDAHEHFVNGFHNGLRINQDVLKEIPRYIRVGKGVINPVLSKFRELELLEQIVPASKLQKLSNGTLIGVTVPSGYDLKKGQSAAQKIEGLINKKIGLDKSNNEITVENIMNSTGKVKVVPLFGDKGRLELLQTRSDEPEDLLNSIEDLRRTILGSIGVPYEIIFGGDDGRKGDLLKRFARYLRLLKNIQRSIVSGVRQIVMIDLSNAGIPFKPSDIEISFRNKLVEINNLDELEFADTTVQMVSNIRDFIFELADKERSPIADNIQLEEFILYLDKQFGSIGLKNLIDTKKKPQEDPPGEFEGDIPDVE